MSSARAASEMMHTARFARPYSRAFARLFLLELTAKGFFSLKSSAFSSSKIDFFLDFRREFPKPVQVNKFIFCMNPI